MPPKRYFEELADGEKFKPGVISDKLREAIGLHQDKIPIWVYRMRVLGYPPGWLNIADMSKTVVPIHDGDGEVDVKPDPTQEATYNLESLVVYPGFNAPLPEDVNDDYKTLRMPPMQLHQQLDFATATMKRPKPVPYKRFKLVSPEKNADQKVDDAKDTAADEDDQEKALDTSIVESEKKITKLISIGSPVPDSYIKQKPPLEKWSENNTMAELIYFENLPNYTGVFEKMTSVLRNVRNKLFNKPSPSSPSTTETVATTETSKTETVATTETIATTETVATTESATEANNNSQESDLVTTAPLVLSSDDSDIQILE